MLYVIGILFIIGIIVALLNKIKDLVEGIFAIGLIIAAIAFAVWAFPYVVRFVHKVMCMPSKTFILLFCLGYVILIITLLVLKYKKTYEEVLKRESILTVLRDFMKNTGAGTDREIECGITGDDNYHDANIYIRECVETSREIRKYLEMLVSKRELKVAPLSDNIDSLDCYVPELYISLYPKPNPTNFKIRRLSADDLGI